MKFLYKLALSLLIFFSVPTFAYAATYYVSPTGSDTNPGTQAAPWKTIQKATRIMVSGDTALVQPGTYNEQVNITTSGITLQAQGKVITKGITIEIQGSSDTVRGFTITDPSSNAGIEVHGDNNLIEGNEIYHTSQDGVWFFGNYNTFRGNYIHDILDPSVPDSHVDCFQTWGSFSDIKTTTTHILIEDNKCVNNGLQGQGNQIIMLEAENNSTVSDITVRNNVFVIYYPNYSPLIFDRASGQPVISNITFVNNTVFNVYGTNNINPAESNVHLIEFSNISNVLAANNLFINSGNANYHDDYISTYQSTNINIHNNAVYNTNGIPPYETPYSGDVWMKDPKVINLTGFDFHLQSDSPLIDVGYNLGSLVTNDYDGVARPQGAGYDIGAYEFGSGATPTGGAPSPTPTVQPTATPTPTPKPTNTPTPTPFPTLIPTPTIKPGDANGDGKVDEVDYGIWLSHFGQMVTGGRTVGDFNTNGIVDGLDYALWLAYYGS